MRVFCSITRSLYARYGIPVLSYGRKGEDTRVSSPFGHVELAVSISRLQTNAGETNAADGIHDQEARHLALTKRYKMRRYEKRGSSDKYVEESRI